MIKISLIYRLFPYPDRDFPRWNPNTLIEVIPDFIILYIEL